MRMNRIGDSLTRVRSLRLATRNAVTSNKNYSASRRNTSSIINKSSSSGISSLLQKLNAKETSSTTLAEALTDKQKKSYNTAIDKYASEIQEYTKEFLDNSESSLFKTAENAEEGSTKENQAVIDKVNAWVDAYNYMVENMVKMGDAINTMYLKQLNTYVSTSKVSLKAIGITQNSDGTLSVNQTKLKGAALKDIKAVFGVKNELADKVSAKAEYIESNAEKNLSKLADSTTSISSNYTESGILSEIYNAIGSTYNSKG